MKRLVFVLALLAAPSFAQQASVLRCADDEVLMVVRVSKLTPGGSEAGFQAAVTAHQAWYRNNGYGDVILSKPVLNRDGTRSKTEFLSLRMSETKAEGRDTQQGGKAWDDFVAMYRTNSEITTETASCLPKGFAAGK